MTTTTTDEALYIQGRAEHADRLGLASRPLPNGTLSVDAEPHGGSGAGRAYVVGFRIGDDGAYRFSCTCPAGTYHRRSAVPCKHAAAAGRFLGDAGLAAYSPDGFSATPFAVAFARTVTGPIPQ